MSRFLGFLCALLILLLINAATALLIAETLIKATQYLIRVHSTSTGTVPTELVSVSLLWRIVPVGLVILATIVRCVVTKEKFSGTSSAHSDAIQFFGKALVAVFVGVMGAVAGMLGGMAVMFVVTPLNAIFNFGLTVGECANLSMVIGAGIGFLLGYFIGLTGIWFTSNNGASHALSDYRDSNGGGSYFSPTPSPTSYSSPSSVYPSPHTPPYSEAGYTPPPPPPDWTVADQARRVREEEERRRNAHNDKLWGR